MAPPEWLDVEFGDRYPTQLALPFLTVDDAATIDAARVAIERAMTFAVGNRRAAEADELARLGDQLVGMLERNAAAVRAQ